MIRFLSTLVLAAASAMAQQPQFDVASVKASPKEGEKARKGGNPFLNENIKATPGGVTMHGVTLKGATQWAYRVFAFQITGPDWIDDDHFEIAAKTAAPTGDEELHLMMQALLAERFGLKLHRQSKEMQAFVLSIAKNGPKFHETTEPGDPQVEPDKQTLSIAVHRMPLSQIMDPLSKVLQMPIVDTTGLTGRYNVTLNVAKYISGANGGPVDPISIIQLALQQDLGLKLEQRKAPVDLLIVDHAEKPQL